MCGGKYFFITSVVVLVCNLIEVSNSQDEKGAIWMPSQFHSKGRNKLKPSYIIIHGTPGDSSAIAAGKWFQTPASNFSTHYIIDQHGTIVQSVKETDSAWSHTGLVEKEADTWWSRKNNPNLLTISILHIKSTTQKDNFYRMTQAQTKASFELVRSIISRHPEIRKTWANSKGGIIGHFSIAPKRSIWCPGPYPWEELFSFLQDGETEGQEQYYCEGVITAPDFLNVRSGPNTKNRILDIILPDEVTSIYGTIKGEPVGGNVVWYFVGYGYISSYYVRLLEPAPDWCTEGSTNRGNI